MTHFLGINFNDGLGDIIVVLIIFAFIFGSRMIRTLTVHQQKMAEIFHRNQATQMVQSNGEYETLRQEVDTLKATVSQQTMLLDTIANQQREMMAAMKQQDSIKERLQQ